MNAEEHYEMHAIVHGKVQGVGFRSTTRHYALKLGLKGTVRNLSDGSVEIKVQGSKDTLEHLMHKLKYESRPACIDNVDLQYLTPIEIFQDFKIIH